MGNSIFSIASLSDNLIAFCAVSLVVRIQSSSIIISEHARKESIQCDYIKLTHLLDFVVFT